MTAFSYDQAFSRNIGWITREEQRVLRGKRIAIAGLGGVGGSHLLTLTRLGVGTFHIADFDSFETANFNRQAGASVSTLGKSKTSVLASMAKDINPELAVTVFDMGVTEGNVDAFLAGVDHFVDGLDFFAFQARRLVFDACDRARIPATTVAPLGMGGALLNFLPGQMSFEQYFQWEGCSEEEMALRFLVGLAPTMLHRKYLADPTAVDLAARRGPSTAVACELCAAIATTQSLKILLERGPVRAAPYGVHFDAYLEKLVTTWRPGGNRHPAQRFAIAFARRKLRKMANQAARKHHPT